MRAVTEDVKASTLEILEKAACGEELGVEDGEVLLRAEGEQLYELLALADRVRSEMVGDVVTYVINRNINFTNFCTGTCMFCAFRRPPGDPAGYRLTVDEIAEKVAEAVREGATEVCVQGGLHPGMFLDDYLEILRTVREVSPDIHIHAFSPAEIDRIATYEKLSVRKVLLRLKDAGLNSVPGTAAEVLSHRVRSLICPDKIGPERWVEVIKECHRVGLPTTSTVLYGTVETPRELAEHIALIRDVQKETGGFTEFIPLRFSPMNTPLWHNGFCSQASLQHSIRVHAVARLMFSGYIDNIQASWVKLGPDGARMMLMAGANDLGGTLMEENITRAAGGTFQYLPASELRRLALQVGRIPRQRSTTYELF